MSISTTKELIEFLKTNKPFFQREFGVSRLGIFGSFAFGKITESSDIDVVIEMEKGKKRLHNFLQLKRLLEKETNRKIDLGFESSLKPIIREHIKSKIIYV